ncbi:hypothetical protein QVD17_36087 [Tagetes erecta]|uniref:Uncharacterized protein n=1 Tax=Tagetes erecta TaxID=13708 RepID=A0AAD8NIP8_TARER|nr:hypothetical protein QVD17_36087 [Tagetes erecta]
MFLEAEGEEENSAMAVANTIPFEANIDDMIDDDLFEFFLTFFFFISVVVDEAVSDREAKNTKLNHKFLELHYRVYHLNIVDRESHIEIIKIVQELETCIKSLSIAKDESANLKSEQNLVQKLLPVPVTNDALKVEESCSESSMSCVNKPPMPTHNDDDDLKVEKTKLLIPLVKNDKYPLYGFTSYHNLIDGTSISYVNEPPMPTDNDDDNLKVEKTKLLTPLVKNNKYPLYGFTSYHNLIDGTSISYVNEPPLPPVKDPLYGFVSYNPVKGEEGSSNYGYDAKDCGSEPKP